MTMKNKELKKILDHVKSCQSCRDHINAHNSDEDVLVEPEYSNTIDEKLIEEIAQLVQKKVLATIKPLLNKLQEIVSQGPVQTQTPTAPTPQNNAPTSLSDISLLNQEVLKDVKQMAQMTMADRINRSKLRFKKK